VTSDGHSPEPVNDSSPGQGFAALRAKALQLRAELENEREAEQAGEKLAGRRGRTEPNTVSEISDQSQIPTSADSGLTPITAILPTRRGRPAGSREEREQITAYLQDFAREMNDQAPLSASVSRALNAFRHANLARERWGDVLYQARSITQERSATITKRADDPGKVFAAKNKMAYFFAVFDDLLGLRPEEPSPSARSAHTP
jgi:hypothetical protein